MRFLRCTAVQIILVFTFLCLSIPHASAASLSEGNREVAFIPLDALLQEYDLADTYFTRGGVSAPLTSDNVEEILSSGEYYIELKNNILGVRKVGLKGGVFGIVTAAIAATGQFLMTDAAWAFAAYFGVVATGVLVHNQHSNELRFIREQLAEARARAGADCPVCLEGLTLTCVNDHKTCRRCYLDMQGYPGANPDQCPLCRDEWVVE